MDAQAKGVEPDKAFGVFVTVYFVVFKGCKVFPIQRAIRFAAGDLAVAFE
jgi:hypothetical protein